MTENESNESAAEPAKDTVAPSEPTSAGAAAPDTSHDEADDGADAGDADDGAEAGDADDGAEGGEGGDAAGKDGAKRKRRRRRKKKKPEGAEGASGGAEPAPAHGKPGSVAPFSKWFEGGERKHAFQTGEIVAGMVTKVERGTATIDLFGKATAFVDVLEPREIEPIPEPVVAATPEAAGDAAPAATEAAEAEVSPEAAASADASGEPAVAHDTVTSAGDVEAAAAEAAVLQEAEDAAATDAGEADAEPEVSDEAAVPSVQGEAVPPPEVGEIFRGRIASVSESGHVVLINRYVPKAAAKERIKQLAAARRRVEGVVYGFNRGGFDVIVEGMRVFCPASAMALEHIEDPASYVGQKLEFTLPPSKGGRSIVVSRRTLLERDVRKQRRDAMTALEVGSRHRGRVIGHREFGVLVDIGGGLEGLVHLSELGWGRGIKPTDIGPVGTEVDVEVVRVVPISRKERFGRISLSTRACLPDPWLAHADILRDGHAVLGKVTRTADFGAFIEIAPGIDGMLHISELGGRDLKHAGQVLKDGEEIAVLIERVDRQNRRIALSRLAPADAEALRAGTFAEGSTRAPKPGALVMAVIEKVEHHGMLVQIEGIVGRNGRGYLSNRDLGEFDGEKRRHLVVGKRLEVKVVGADREGGLKVSIKAKQIDEERNAVRDYKRESSKQGFGTFGDLLRAKLGTKS